MSPLTSSERRLIDRILESMPKSHLKNYSDYTSNAGYFFMEFEDIELTHSLHRKGWLTRARSYFEPNDVHLTKSAWMRFEIQEWSEIEESEIETKRGEESGSW